MYRGGKWKVCLYLSFSYLEKGQDHKNKNIQHNLISLISDWLPTNIVGIEENFKEIKLESS